MLKLKNYIKNALPLAILVALLPVAGALAASTSQQPNITQAYSSDQQLEQGMIVGLDPNNSAKVMALSVNHIDRMQGIVVSPSSAPVTLGNQTYQNQVFVATLGRYPVLVSDQDGPISAGDYITISSLAGIGMKADTTGQLVVGKATSSFDGKSNVLGNTTLKTDQGQSQKVDIGLINVDLGIAHNPLNTTSKQLLGFTFFEDVAKTLTGKTVSPPHIYAGLIIFVVIAMIAAAVLYSGIRGDMIATGRNPLAKAAISRNLFEVVLVAVVIFVIGLGAVYLVLKL